MQEGIIIKTATDHEVIFANETAKTILNNSTDMSVKRFTAVDLRENKNPLLEEDEGSGESQAKPSSKTRNKLSLNTIVKRLHNDGDNEFSNSTIYKVSIPKTVSEAARAEGRRLITYAMVEASLKVFRG